MKSGIYKIINPINNKIYIGSAVNLEIRRKKHLERLQKNKHHSIHLQRAYNIKEIDFVFEVIEFCEVVDLVKIEQYYIDTLKPEYNISPTAYSSLGIKRRQETKDKISQTLTGRIMSQTTKDKIGLSNLGKSRTDITKEKYSNSKKGLNNPIFKVGWDKQIEAMKKANLGKKRPKEFGEKIAEKLSKPIIQYSLNDEEIKEWNSAVQVEKELGFSNGAINRVCSGKTNSQGNIAKTAYGYKWKFKIIIDENN